LLRAAQGLDPFIADGLVTWDGARLTVTEAGRAFVRNIAALFDSYLIKAPAPRHASAI
jgi:oxygen-independent coproporphyrinogen-3 oxidase